MTSAALLDKATAALRSAEHLLELGDAEGASDRAYYALFHAARALLASVAPDETSRLKTHSSVISAFGLIGVRKLGLPDAHGRLLNFAEELRRKADYEAAVFADREAVREILSGAAIMIADVETIVRGRP